MEYGEGKFLILFQSSGLFVVNYCAMLVFKNEENSVQQQLFFSPQLLITVAFSQPVKLYSMKLQGPDNGE